MTAFIMLAAGMSQRFGNSNKLFAQLNGKPLAKHVVDALAPLNASQRYVVISDENEKLSDLFSGYISVLNPDPESGQWSSIRLGVQRALKDGAERAVVCLSDMPRIPTSHYAQLGSCKISTMTLVDDVRQPPALFVGDDLKALAKLKSGEQGKAVLVGRTGTLKLAANLAIDVDVQEDLVKLSRG